MTENIQWRVVDCRKDVNGEFGFCKNGHECFVSSYLSFPIGKKAIVRCEKCGVEVLRYAPFRITMEEIDTDEDIMQEIVLRYKPMNSVVKITRTHEYESQISIRVYLCIDHYDDIMDELLDIEYEIRKKFSDIIFDFLYLPTYINTISSGTVIFQRK